MSNKDFCGSCELGNFLGEMCNPNSFVDSFRIDVLAIVLIFVIGMYIITKKVK